MVEQLVVGLDVGIAERALACQLAVTRRAPASLVRTAIEAVTPRVLNFAGDSQRPVLVRAETQVVRQFTCVVPIGWVAETQRRGACIAISAVVAEDQSRVLPVGRMEHAPSAGVHAAHHEHVGEVGNVAELQRNFGRVARVVLDRDRFRIVVAECPVASKNKHLLWHQDFTALVADVEVRRTRKALGCLRWRQPAAPPATAHSSGGCTR